MINLEQLRIFIDDIWVRFKTHSEDASAHHDKYTSAEVDAVVATHTAVTSAHHTKTIDASELSIGEINGARIPMDIARDSEVTSAVSTHAGVAGAHHTKYSDANAVDAIEAAAELDLKLFNSVTQPRAWVYNTAQQTLTTGIWATLTWTIAEYNVSPGASPLWSLATNPSRFTVKYPGLYRVRGYARFVPNGTGRRLAYIRKNGTINIIGFEAAPSTVGYVSVAPDGLFELAEDDYLEMFVYQNSGGNLNIQGGSTVTGFVAARLY